MPAETDRESQTIFRRLLGTSSIGLTLVLIAALLVLATSPTPASAHVLPAPSGRDPNQFAWRVLTLVNQHRVSHGVPKLRMIRCDRTYARSWASHLDTNNDWHHSNLYRLLDRCDMHAAAENLVMFPDGMTPRQVVRLWMNSPGHRRALLNPTYRLTGVSFVWDHDQRVWYGVQEFSVR